MAEPWQDHYRAVLARRLQDQSPRVRQRLAQRLQALADMPVSPPAVSATPRATGRDRAPLLAALNAQLADRLAGAAGLQRPVVAGAAATATLVEASDAGELSSVRRFRHTWAKVAAEQQMLEALARAPRNAGPLNSHRLMLRALTLMRQRSPDYLRHYLEQMQALLWLEDSVARLPQATPRKGARAPRRKA